MSADAINLDDPVRAFAFLIGISAFLPNEVMRLHDAIVINLAKNAGIGEAELRRAALDLAALTSEQLDV